jgi:hypothetical protein
MSKPITNGRSTSSLPVTGYPSSPSPRQLEPIGTFFADSLDRNAIETFRDDTFLVNDATEDLTRLLKPVSIHLGSIDPEAALIMVEGAEQGSFQLKVVMCAREGERRRVIRYTSKDTKRVVDLLKNSAELTSAILAQF